MKGRRSYEIRSGGKKLAVEQASSPREALFEYLRAHGCWDHEIVQMSSDVLVWRGAAFKAELDTSHLRIAS